MLQEASLMNLEERPLGEIAVALPGATAVFREAGLDYCCGGQISLGEAAQAKSLDLAAIVAKLRGLQPESVSTPTEQETAALIETIVTRYHRVHSQELPELIRLAERVETVHQGHDAVPAGLADLLKGMFGELTMHMQKEEIVLFPQMRNGATMPLQFPISAMMAEHTDHGAQVEEIKRLTHDITVPADGCRTWQALYAGLGKFIDDLIDHIHIENNILFPRFL